MGLAKPVVGTSTFLGKAQYQSSLRKRESDLLTRLAAPLMTPLAILFMGLSWMCVVSLCSCQR